MLPPKHKKVSDFRKGGERDIPIVTTPLPINRSLVLIDYSSGSPSSIGDLASHSSREPLMPANRWSVARYQDEATGAQDGINESGVV